MNTLKNLKIIVYLLSLIFIGIIVFTGCQKDKYTNVGKKILYFKGKNLICKSKLLNKYNSKIINDNVYKNEKFIDNIKNCKIKKY